MLSPIFRGQIIAFGPIANDLLPDPEETEAAADLPRDLSFCPHSVDSSLSQLKLSYA